MSKIHLQLNKESLIIIITALCIGVLVVVNLFILVPALSKIFSIQRKVTSGELIDAQTVEQAVELLTQ